MHSGMHACATPQVALLSGLLEGVAVPPSLALCGGRLSVWLSSCLGLRDPSWLLPSVRWVGCCRHARTPGCGGAHVLKQRWPMGIAMMQPVDDLMT